MKKTYATPTLFESGSIVRETLGGGPLFPKEVSVNYRVAVQGNLGFHL
jgi:hypothetical protein